MLLLGRVEVDIIGPAAKMTVSNALQVVPIAQVVDVTVLRVHRAYSVWLLAHTMAQHHLFITIVRGQHHTVQWLTVQIMHRHSF